MIRLSVTDADFETQFIELLGQARETTETVDRAVSDIIAAVRQLEDQVEVALVLEELDELHDVRVVHEAQHLDLVHDAGSAEKAGVRNTTGAVASL